MFQQTLDGGAGNRESARLIFSVASLLESLGANPYRVRAYRRAAVGMLRLPVEAHAFLTDAGELSLPWLGPRLRRKLGELVRRGRMQFYDDLLEELPAPFRALLAIPGVGPRTAARLLSELRLFSVEDVARAAREGRLQTLRGIGAIRQQRIGEAAEALLAAQRATHHAAAAPNVGVRALPASDEASPAGGVSLLDETSPAGAVSASDGVFDSAPRIRPQ
jgi:DNA polymerase (family 10)